MKSKIVRILLSAIALLFFGYLAGSTGIAGLQKAIRLEQSHKFALATIVAKNDEFRDFYIRYRFSVTDDQGQEKLILIKEDTDLFLNASVGSSEAVSVMYDPSDPNVAMIVGNNRRYIIALIMAGMLVCAAIVSTIEEVVKLRKQVHS